MCRGGGGSCVVHVDGNCWDIKQVRFGLVGFLLFSRLNDVCSTVSDAYNLTWQHVGIHGTKFGSFRSEADGQQGPSEMKFTHIISTLFSHLARRQNVKTILVHNHRTAHKQVSKQARNEDFFFLQN